MRCNSCNSCTKIERKIQILRGALWGEDLKKGEVAVFIKHRETMRPPT